MPFGIAAIGAVGSVASGLIGSSAAKSAASTQAAATDRATQAEMSMYNQNVAREAPFVAGGTNALNQLQQLLSGGSPVLSMLGIGPGGGGTGTINPALFQGSPGYQWQLGQGMNAITNSAAARTGIGGNTLAALQTYGTGLANQDFWNYVNQLNSGYNSQVGNLYNLTALGANAAGNLGTQGTAVANQVGANTIGAGNAAAGGIVGSSNAITGGINSALQSLLVANQMKPGGLFSFGGGTSPSPVTMDTPNLVWNPYNPVGTETLGAGTIGPAYTP